MLRSLRAPVALRVYRSLALVLVGALLVGGGAAAMRLAEPNVELGDRVSYQVYAYREADGLLIYTTDKARAEQEISAGNEILAALPEATFTAPTRDVALRNNSLDPIRFILGHEVGDVVVSPSIRSPFGRYADLPTETIPRTIGPIPVEFTIELAKVYADNASSWFKKEIPREHLVAGNVIPYIGGSKAEVVEVTEETVRLRFLIDEDTPSLVRSLGLDIPFHIEPISKEAVLLHVALGVGDSFKTTGCQDQGISLRPGEYIVEASDDKNLTLRSKPQPHLVPFLDQTVRFEFHVIDLEKSTQFGPTRILATLARTLG